MNIITLFIALVGGFMIIGFIAAIFQNKEPDDESRNEDYSSQVVISQEVPSVFDAFNGKEK